jgi:transposase
MSPQRFLQWAAELPAGCVVAMESCSGAHHLARRQRLMGLDARLIAAHFIAAFRVQGACGKNDANDAAAICEAASRPRTRFVTVKTPDQQGWQGIHRLREGHKEERTACINSIRGLLAEFGLLFPQSPDALRRVLLEVLEDASNELPGMMRLGLQRAQAHWRVLDDEIAWCDSQVRLHVRQAPAASRATQLHGVGELTASAMVAAVGDMHQFASGRQFGAWLGLVPSQNWGSPSQMAAISLLAPVALESDSSMSTLARCFTSRTSRRRADAGVRRTPRAPRQRAQRRGPRRAAFRWL